MIRNGKRIRAALLAAALVFTQLGATAYAAEPPADAGLCEHHPEHTAKCGYTEARPGHDCEHQHTPDCYADEPICGMDEDAEQTDADAGHTHGQACYALDCPHERGEHDADCGYMEAVPDRSCGFVCKVCAGEPDKDIGKEEPAADKNDLTPPEKTGPKNVSPKGGEAVTVTAFDGLDDEVERQIVPAGTPLDDLTLPATLGASGYIVAGGADPEPEAITITGVAWEPDSPWDDTAGQGGYTFTPILPAGYTLAGGVEPPEINVRIGGAITFALQSSVLTAEFDNNGSGGTDADNNKMNDAIAAALAVLPADSYKTITTIKLTGDAAEITKWNWKYLIGRYDESSGWDSLTALDLSGMTNLTTVKNDTGYTGSNPTKLKTVELPGGVAEIGDSAFSSCSSLNEIIMEPMTAPTLGNDVFKGTNITFYVPKDGTGYNSGGWENLHTVEYSPTTALSLPATLILWSNGRRTLTATFTPDDATFKDISWESSDTGVATVDKNGNVTAVAAGTATITATSRQGRKTATCAVTVKTAPPALSITLNIIAPSHGVLTVREGDSTGRLLADGDRISDGTVVWATASADPGWQVDGIEIAGRRTPRDTVSTMLVGDGVCEISAKISPRPYDAQDHTSSRHYTTTPEPSKPDNPVLAVVELPVSVGSGAATGKPDDGRTASAIAGAGRNAKAKTNGIAVQYDAKTSLAYDGFSIVIARATLDRLIAAKVKYVTLNTSIVDMTFDLAALQEIAAKSTGDITLTAVRETGLAGDALDAVGSRPAYRLAVGYTGADGKTATVQSFGAGRVTLGLAYKPAATEQTGALFLVYSADGKDAQWLYQSSYDRNSGNVIASTGHLSVYGVGYQTAPAFTDTGNHWAKADIDFVASRGLFQGADGALGTPEATFSPDGTITRGMFVTALGRLAGIDPAAYPSSRFNDVAGASIYAPYVEWAASKGIVSGTGEKTFSPDSAITREQMAVIMQRYAQRLGYTLPVARKAVTFTDENQITGSIKGAVQRVQQAGIMSGKGNNRFGPKDAATRAEAAVALRRFVEVVIDRGTAGGWGQNDAGRWLYYLDGKPVSGWKQIEGKWYWFDAAGLMQAGGWKQVGDSWYYFYPDGSMAVSTKVDGYEVGPDGVRKEKE